jgi:hypothetical protein
MLMASSGLHLPKLAHRAGSGPLRSIGVGFVLFRLGPHQVRAAFDVGTKTGDRAGVSKVAISGLPDAGRCRSGVPILQALTIVKETAGNVIVSNAVSSVHESVKEGETITAPLEASGVFPPMVISMVDVGEQTGALPEMLLKIADNYDDEVDNAVAAMTSLLEPIMIVFLAVIVGSIVIALFLPLIELMNGACARAARRERLK